MISIQSTSHGLVCNKCIDQLVGDVIKMRSPWTKEEVNGHYMEVRKNEKSKKRNTRGV